MAPATAEDPTPDATSSPGILTAAATQEDEPESGETTSSSSSPHARGSPSTQPETQATPAIAETATHSAPPLPDEPLPPPLPDEPVPETLTASTTTASDDGWEPVWDATAGAYYFYNRFTQASQWENPRVPNAVGATSANHTAATGLSAGGELHPAVLGGYNPAIHGDFDPNADYAQVVAPTTPAGDIGAPGTMGAPGTDAYAQTAGFNRFTGKYQIAGLTPENFNDDNKSRRQMNAFFDVDAAANSHDGRSLKAERAGKKLTKNEVKAFREKRREKKEEKRRAWLRD